MTSETVNSDLALIMCARPVVSVFALLFVEFAGVTITGERKEYAVAVRTGHIVSFDSVISAGGEGAVIYKFLDFSLGRHPCSVTQIT